MVDECVGHVHELVFVGAVQVRAKSAQKSIFIYVIVFLLHENVS